MLGIKRQEPGGRQSPGFFGMLGASRMLASVTGGPW
jgi:hypothetical protein